MADNSDEAGNGVDVAQALVTTVIFVEAEQPEMGGLLLVLGQG
jgi:hypothetical protein